jgi:hypothetical protein
MDVIKISNVIKKIIQKTLIAVIAIFMYIVIRKTAIIQFDIENKRIIIGSIILGIVLFILLFIPVMKQLKKLYNALVGKAINQALIGSISGTAVSSISTIATQYIPENILRTILSFTEVSVFSVALSVLIVAITAKIRKKVLL